MAVAVRAESVRDARWAEHAPRWCARLALATALAALPLVVFGGLVTTLRAGMAIDGWLVLEPGRGDHFLLFYPAEKWFRDLGTFTEHTHRLFGTLVGLLAIASVVAAFAERAGRQRWVALVALLAVCGQGLLGGLRVLEASPQLAFLHGAFAQAVFAWLATAALLASPAWRAAGARAGSHRARPPAGAAGESAAPLALAWTLLALVYATIFVGAWTRHSGSQLAFGLHVALVAVVLPLAGSCARRLRLAADAAPIELAPHLRRARARLNLALGAQVVLGLLAALGVFAFSGGFEAPVSTGELVFSTLHVLVGALLLAQCAAVVCWTSRARSPGATATPEVARDESGEARTSPLGWGRAGS